MLKKKIVSILLSLMMVLTLLPTTMFMADVENETAEEYVYISVSYDGQFVEGQNGAPVVYQAVAMEEVKAIDLDAYGLGDFYYDADGDGEYDLTALHLYVYVHEEILGLDWSDVYVSGYPGSIFFESGLFGFVDCNLNYYLNGAYPEISPGWGATADNLVLRDGDFYDIAGYTSWAFWMDPAAGFRYFADENGEITHAYETEAGSEFSISLVKAGGGFGGETLFNGVAGQEVFYGTALGEVTGSVITDDNGCAEIPALTAGTWYLWCNGGGGEYYPDDIVSSPAYAEITVTGLAADPIDVNVTIADKGTVVMAKETVTVTDLDASGDFTVDEVLDAAHKSVYEGGASAGYGSAMGDYGLYITMLWGDQSGNFGYWLNDASCWSLADLVEAGDDVVAFVYQNTEVWDSYARFAQDSYTIKLEESSEFVVEKAGYDANWNTVFAAHKGATLKVYDTDFIAVDESKYNVTDNGDGTYSVVIKELGEFIVVAYDNVTPIVPAITTVTVASNDNVVYANAVEVKITAIGTVTSNSKDVIEAARTAYEALTEEQKVLVENYDVLVAAEEALATINADMETASIVVDKINEIGTVTIHSARQIVDARNAYEALTETQKGYVKNYKVLTDIEAAIVILYAEAAKADHKATYEATGKYLSKLGTPTVGSTGGEWMIIDLVRAGYDCPKGYYENVVKYVQENINEKEQLHRSKGTDNSRVILALTAAGYDVMDVDGHNLLMGLTDMTYVKKQGINGPIWALIAFDSYDYEIPVNVNATEQVTREGLIAYILDKQLEDGGWALSGKIADPDMTGMAIQALAPYYKTNAKVKEAVDKALVMLSEIQLPNGGFGSMDGTCSESCAQVIVALTALGINPETDARFVKNGVSVVDAMCLFAVEGGGFAHVPNGGLNGMATEQSQYALVAYFRFLEGKTALYDMSDVRIGGDVTEEVPEVKPEAKPEDKPAVKPEDKVENVTMPETESEKAENVTAPVTGDNSNVGFYIVLAACGMVLVLNNKKFFVEK